MGRTTTPLTNTQIQQAKPSAKEYNLADGQGLMLRVKPNGTKLWLFNYYRPHTKKRANISFGSYPDITLAQARTSRSEAKELLSKDIDPKEHREQTARQEELAHNATFEKVAAQFHEIKKTTVSSDHANKIWNSLEVHIFPSIGKMPIHKLDAPTALKAIAHISNKSPETGKRLSQRINAVMTYALNTGLIEHNPLSGISSALKRPEKTKMPSIPPSQLPQFMQRVSTANIKLVTRFLIEWQLHTMVRPSEAAGATWSEIDLEKQQWLIPAARMKKKRDHAVPLTSQTLSLLEAIRPITGNSEYIFPSHGSPRKPTNSSTANMAIKRMGYHGKLVAHGMRSIASTALNEQGFDPDVIESCLAHVDKNESRAAYNRTDYFERRKTVMCWWSNYIEQAATGSVSLATSKQGLRVVNS